MTDSRIPFNFDIADSDRSSDVVTTYTIPEFRVSAFRSDEWGEHILMDNVVVTRTGINSWAYSPPVKWPEGQTVDFFAVSPSSVHISNNQWWHHTFRYDNSQCATDLLVSVRKKVNQSDGKIRLNFRHALARVQIRLKCSLPNTYVNISEVEICNFANSGTFFFPDHSTSPDTNRGEIFDCWESYNNQDDITIFRPEDGSTATLSADPVVFGPENLFMIPDSLTLFKPDIIWEGAHIMISYVHAGKKEIARVPIREATPEKRWLPGVSYRYTIDIAPNATRSSASSSPDTSIVINCTLAEI